MIEIDDASYVLYLFRYALTDAGAARDIARSIRCWWGDIDRDLQEQIKRELQEHADDAFPSDDVRAVWKDLLEMPLTEERKPTHQHIEDMLNEILNRGFENVIAGDDPAIRAIGFTCWNVDAAGEEKDTRCYCAPMLGMKEFCEKYPRMLQAMATPQGRINLARLLVKPEHRTFQALYEHLQSAC